MNTFISQKVRTNAMISYFFLGWLFLLARKNPDFSDPFVRAHSKSATKMHLGFLGGFWIYSHYLSTYLPSFTFPLLPTLTLDKIISICFFILLAALIIRGAYLAFHGTTSEETNSGRLKEAFKRENISIENASETDKTVYLSSYIPLLGLVTAGRHGNPITRTGAKIGSIWIFLTILLTIIGQYSEIIWVLLFAYLLFVAFVGVSLFVSDTVVGFTILEKIPDLKTTYAGFRAIPTYIFNLLKIIFGKTGTLDFTTLRNEITSKDQTHSELAMNHFTDASLPFPRSLIFIPILNIIFIPQLFLKKQGTYTLAILQGIVMTITLLVIWFFIDFTSFWQMLLLFPMFIGMAEVSHNPFYKIPVIYELYVILDFLTFGLGSRIQKLKEKNKESGEKVSFKV